MTCLASVCEINCQETVDMWFHFMDRKEHNSKCGCVVSDISQSRDYAMLLSILKDLKEVRTKCIEQSSVASRLIQEKHRLEEKVSRLENNVKVLHRDVNMLFKLTPSITFERRKDSKPSSKDLQTLQLENTISNSDEVIKIPEKQRETEQSYCLSNHCHMLSAKVTDLEQRNKQASEYIDKQKIVIDQMMVLISNLQTTSRLQAKKIDQLSILLEHYVTVADENASNQSWLIDSVTSLRSQYSSLKNEISNHYNDTRGIL